MKKVYLLFLLALLSAAQALADVVEINGINYNLLSSNTAEVTKSNNYSGNIIIPATITYDGTTYDVTGIGERAFYRCSKLTSITIPESVTSIGEGVFNGCM